MKLKFLLVKRLADVVVKRNNNNEITINMGNALCKKRSIVLINILTPLLWA
jgi:flagellar biogenesis protein FliO